MKKLFEMEIFKTICEKNVNCIDKGDGRPIDNYILINLQIVSFTTNIKNIVNFTKKSGEDYQKYFVSQMR